MKETLVRTHIEVAQKAENKLRLQTSYLLLLKSLLENSF